MKKGPKRVVPPAWGEAQAKRLQVLLAEAGSWRGLDELEEVITAHLILSEEPDVASMLYQILEEREPMWDPDVVPKEFASLFALLVEDLDLRLGEDFEWAYPEFPPFPGPEDAKDFRALARALRARTDMLNYLLLDLEPSEEDFENLQGTATQLAFLSALYSQTLDLIYSGENMPNDKEYQLMLDALDKLDGPLDSVSDALIEGEDLPIPDFLRELMEHAEGEEGEEM